MRFSVLSTNENFGSVQYLLIHMVQRHSTRKLLQKKKSSTKWDFIRVERFYETKTLRVQQRVLSSGNQLDQPSIEPFLVTFHANWTGKNCVKEQLNSSSLLP